MKKNRTPKKEIKQYKPNCFRKDMNLGCFSDFSHSNILNISEISQQEPGIEITSFNLQEYRNLQQQNIKQQNNYSNILDQQRQQVITRKVFPRKRKENERLESRLLCQVSAYCKQMRSDPVSINFRMKYIGDEEFRIYEIQNSKFDKIYAVGDFSKIPSFNSSPCTSKQLMDLYEQVGLGHIVPIFNL